MKYLFFFVLSLKIFSAEILSQRENIYVLKDNIYIENISPQNAKKELLKNMRIEVLSYSNGIDVNSSSLLERNSDGKSNFSSMTKQKIDGIILKEKIISEEKKSLNGFFVLEMQVEFTIGKQKGTKDIYYNLNIEGLQNIYKEGDKLKFSLEVSKDSYIYILIKDEDNNLYMYYPNKFSKNNYLKANTKLDFPDKSFFDIILSTSGKKEVNENLIILALKKEINFIGFKYNKDYGVETSTYETYINQIVNISKDNSVQEDIIYRIIKE